MSHEIRTPMNAVIGLSHLALTTPLDARQRDYIQKIHQSGSAMLGIIDDILDVSKLEAGRLNLERIAFRLDDVLGHAMGMVQQRAAEKGLELLLDADPHLPQRLYGDPLRLGQVLVNLLGNAVKFTPTGEVELKVRARHDDDGKLELRVRDTGIGMSPEQAARLFHPFTQADPSTTRRFGGTGLGLTISRRLVDAMGGTIGLQSEPDVGTVFTVTLPLEAAPDEVVTRWSLGALQHLRVLIVDDHAAARETLAAQVNAVSSVPARTAPSGIAALEVLREAPFDLVLMDRHMPGMDGLQATARLRSELAAPPPVVMV